MKNMPGPTCKLRKLRIRWAELRTTSVCEIKKIQNDKLYSKQPRITRTMTVQLRVRLWHAVHVPKKQANELVRKPYLLKFEGFTSHAVAAMAQWIRRLPTEQKIRGSNPRWSISFLFARCLFFLLELALFLCRR